MILTFRYRIKDNSAHKSLRAHAIAVNQVWNYCNAVQRDIEDRYRAGAPKRKWPTHFDFTGLTSGVSVDLGIRATCIGEVCRQYTQSRNKNRRSVRFRTSFGPRRSLGWVPFRRSKQEGNWVVFCGKKYRFFGTKRRPLPADIKTGAFVEDARRHWYVTFQAEAQGLPAGPGSIGIDLGLKALATCSDGFIIPARQHYRKYEKTLGIAQRANNKRLVKGIYAKIANARRDQAHKATTKIALANSLIVVGNVNAASLKKTRMAKSVSDAGWSMFRNMLRYKASRHGARFIEADERFTSQACSCCGAISVSSPKGMGALGIRRWECSDCGASHDRDVNAARNILRVGLSAQAHADGSRRIAQ